jgi:hypothetical protein
MDDITTQFEQFASRAPREGDFFAEEPTTVFDPERGHPVSIRQCWQYRDGRWEGFISVGRGAPWAR